MKVASDTLESAELQTEEISEGSSVIGIPS